MAKNNLAREFKSFVRHGNAVDMGVGVVVGAVLASMVKSLVKDIIMPPLGMLFGGVDLSQLFIVLDGGHYSSLAAARNAGAVVMNIGGFLDTVVGFVLTLFAVFIVLKVIKSGR